MEERERIKIGPDFEGSKKLELSKIDEALKLTNAEIRLDTFIDQAQVRKVEGIVRDMMKEKGFTDAEVTHEIKAVAGGPKLVHLIFNINEGPSVKIRKIDFIGNTAISDGTLKGRMKATREEWFLSFINGRGTYQETRFDEDAGKIVEFYQNQGYIKANVGAPETQRGRRFRGQEDAVDRAADSGDGRAALQGRHLRLLGQYGREDRGAASRSST